MIDVTNPFPNADFVSIKINDWERKQKRLLELMDQTEMVYSWEVNTSFPFAGSSEHLQEVGDILDEEFRIFSDYVKHTEFSLSIWFQSYKAGDHHRIHNHIPGCRYASIIYLCYDPLYHFPTQYVQTSPYTNQLETWSNNSASEGYWYLWPAATYHYTLPYNHSDAPTRKIMSINLEFIDG